MAARPRDAGQAHRRVHTRPLTPADARAIAALEDDTYPVTLRAGRRALEEDIEDADRDGANLGMGLFDGDTLVGIYLLYYEADSCRLFDYFGVERPPDVEAEECLYVADFIVRRAYSRYMWRLLADCLSRFRRYYGLPMLAFSSRSALERWLDRRKAFARFGYAYVDARRFELDGPPHETFLVRFEPSFARAGAPADTRAGLSVEVVQTRLGWRKLQADWDRLLHETPGWTAFQSFEMQSIWWDHLAAGRRPLIVVARDGLGVCAIAPLCVVNTDYYGRPKRLVTFIGEHSEIDRPTILRRGEDREAIAAIFEHVIAQGRVWDTLTLIEQPAGGTVPAVAAALLSETMLVGVVPGPSCPWVDLNRSWEGFLASKSGAFRKLLRRKRARLRAKGVVSFSTCETWPAVEQAFRDYLDVEQRSWKPGKKVGVARSPASLEYHWALVKALGPDGRIIFRTLCLDGRPIAATFGILHRGQFLSLHIAHDRELDDCSPGVLLTAYELEEAYGRADHERYELLGGFLENKTSWTANARETCQVYAYPREPMFRLHYAWFFRIEPLSKRILRRLGLLRFAVAVKRALRKVLFGAEEPPV